MTSDDLSKKKFSYKPEIVGMVVLFSVFIIAILFTGFFGPSSHVLEIDDGSDVYLNDTYNYAIRYPRTWERLESKGGFFEIIAPDNDKIAITVDPVAKPATDINDPDAFIVFAKESLRKYLEENSIEAHSYSNYIICDDKTCMFVSYKYEHPDFGPVKAEVYHYMETGEESSRGISYTKRVTVILGNENARVVDILSILKNFSPTGQPPSKPTSFYFSL